MSETGSRTDLQPISYQGFTNMLQRVFGSMFDPLPLRGKTIASVATSEDKERLIFTLTDGRTITYSAQGDCCSNSWIEHLTVPPDVAGSEVTGFAEQDMGEFQEDYETIRIYQTRVVSQFGIGRMVPIRRGRIDRQREYPVVLAP